MNQADYLELQSRICRRASRWERHMKTLAMACEETGHYREAESMRAIGMRAWVMAEAFLSAAVASK